RRPGRARVYACRKSDPPEIPNLTAAPEGHAFTRAENPIHPKSRISPPPRKGTRSRVPKIRSTRNPESHRRPGRARVYACRKSIPFKLLSPLIAQQSREKARTIPNLATTPEGHAFTRAKNPIHPKSRISPPPRKGTRLRVP